MSHRRPCRNGRVATLERQSREGNGDASMQLAMLYACGDEVKADLERMRDLLALAVDQGNAKAMFILGDMFEDLAKRATNEETRRGYQEQMVSLFTRAVDKGLPDAMVRLGDMYRTGLFLAQDEARAFRLYEQAMNARLLDGMYWVAVCHTRGCGTIKSAELAKATFEIAARNDHVASMRALAVMYRAGLGTPVNEGKAISWDRRADRIERSDRRRGLVMDE